ncbi:MAG: hypothetical protein GYA51_08375 [Candidatus Methanofastidiosa archaeon]|nr:hypothetical protein [Candidatus Methanofastidiosa archaeon]
MLDQWFKSSLFFILILWIFLWLCGHFGLLQHWLVKSKIYRLSGSARATAGSEFYARGKPKHFLAGTLAKVNLRNGGGVWAWTNQGFKYFQADQDTLYFYYDLCVARGDSEDSDFKVNDSSRIATTSIQEWAALTQTGNFIQALLTIPNDGEMGNLGEIYAYSQPLFLPLQLERLCQN